MFYNQMLQLSLIVCAAIAVFAVLPFQPGQNQALREVENRAIATYLSSSSKNLDDDPEFDAVRALIFQVLHQSHTRTSLKDSLLILVSPELPESKKAILESEGARVLPLQPIQIQDDALKSLPPHLRDDLSVLRLFELEEYHRILFIQPHMLLTRPLDAIWGEPTAQRMQLTRRNGLANRTDEAAAPGKYLFVSPPERDTRTPNAGFLLLRPDRMLFKYYLSVLNNDPCLTLQGALNHAHRRDGNMPWAQISASKWNTDVSADVNLAADCATIYTDFALVRGPSGVNKKFLESWWATQSRMKAFWFEQGGKARYV